MGLEHRSIIARGVFAVAVVTVTALVGVVGFAQAARPAATDNGYGSQGGQVQAAIQQFQKSVHDAVKTLNGGIKSCVADSNDQDITPDVTAQNDAAVSQFSAQMASPAALGDSTTSANNHFAAANRQLSAAFEKANTNRGSDLSACIQTAQSQFLASIEAARQQLLDTLRNIFS